MNEDQAEYYQIQSARNAIAREIARAIGRPSDEVMKAKVEADDALARYRDAVRAAAREAIARM